MTLSRASLFRTSLVLQILVYMAAATVDGTGEQVVQASDKIGWVASANKPFRLFCRTNAAGGFREIYVFRGDEPVFYARDVTAYLWVNSRVIYSASPIYGKSGIFIIDPKTEIESTILEGASGDYIGLSSYSPSSHRLKYTRRRL